MVRSYSRSFYGVALFVCSMKFWEFLCLTIKAEFDCLHLSLRKYTLDFFMNVKSRCNQGVIREYQGVSGVQEIN